VLRDDVFGADIKPARAGWLFRAIRGSESSLIRIEVKRILPTVGVFKNPAACVVTQGRDGVLISKLDAARVSWEVNPNDALGKARSDTGGKKWNGGEGGKKGTAVHASFESIGEAQSRKRRNRQR
jgi:hypothetical protein